MIIHVTVCEKTIVNSEKETEITKKQIRKLKPKGNKTLSKQKEI